MKKPARTTPVATDPGPVAEQEARPTPVAPPPGVRGPARTGTRAADVLDRVRPGDVVVLLGTRWAAGVGHAPDDLGAGATDPVPGEPVPGGPVVVEPTDALALVGAGAVAVLSDASLLSAASREGVRVLLEAGVVVVDQLERIETGVPVREGRTLRVEGGRVWPGARGRTRERTATGEQASTSAGTWTGAPAAPLARGRVLDPSLLPDVPDVPDLPGPPDLPEGPPDRADLLARVDALTHDAAAFLHREHDLVVHGTGLPALGTPVAGRPVVVVARAGEHEAELVSVLRFVREQNPVLVAVGRAADDVLDSGLAPHVVVLSPADPASVPSLDALRAADDVVVQVRPGSGTSVVDSLARLGTRPLVCETGATAEDVALLLAGAGDPAVVIGVGLHAGLTGLPASAGGAPASTHLVRLRLGTRLVDATAVPHLYAGQVRPWHLLVVLLAGWLALAGALSVTPVGQEWLAAATGALSGFVDNLRGLF